MEKQRTIADTVSLSGIGLHTGTLTTVTFKPAQPGSGITFYRTDLPDKPAIKADIDHVCDVSRGTTIGINGAKIYTVEHVLAAIAGLGIDNIDIELDEREIPNDDGSALPFLNTLKKAGIVEQDAERKYVHLEDPVYLKSGDVTLSFLPADDFRVTMTIAFDHVAVGTQYASFDITPETFENELAPARTFCFLSEVKMLQEQQLIKGGSLESAVVIGDEAILNDSLRFPDEPVRHKILDLIGDMALLGMPIKGHIVAVKTGHEKNIMFSKRIKKALQNGHTPAAEKAPEETTDKSRLLDVMKIMKIIPHRFPFLMVDRILSYEPQKSAIGIKNVSIGEPYFQGHWPDMPVMPGVLIIEAMAQVSSVLIFGEENVEGKLPFFMGIDKAKFRRSVQPGDQLFIECELLRLRKRAAKVKAVAKVDGKVVAEAEMMFGLLPSEKKE